MYPLSSSSNSSGAGQPTAQAPQESKTQTVAQKKICGACLKENPSASLCSRCMAVYYCNKSCQTVGWAFHKEFCTPHANVAIPMKAVGLYLIPVRRENDIVSFSTQFSLGTVVTLKSQGYKGLENVNPIFLRHQNYVEILKHIWTEPSTDFKISWLKTHVEQGHPILMLELGKVLFIQMSKNNDFPLEKVRECMRWFLLGLHCTRLDVACCKDKSAAGAVDVLQAYYRPSLLIPSSKIDEAVPNLPQFQKAVLEGWVPGEKNPSPEWVAYHGIQCSSEAVSMIPQEEWTAVRTKLHLEILASL